MCTRLRFRLSLLELDIEDEEVLMTLEVAATAAADEGEVMEMAVYDGDTTGGGFDNARG